MGIFGFMRRKGKEPTTPTKIAIGLVITALSALVMVAAVNSVNVENEKASALWLIATYGVITVGELCLSPMGLSLVSKLSPPRLTALMMGGFSFPLQLEINLQVYCPVILKPLIIKQGFYNQFYISNDCCSFAVWFVKMAKQSYERKGVS